MQQHPYGMTHQEYNRHLSRFLHNLSLSTNGVSMHADAILHWYRRRYLPCPYQQPDRRPPASAHVFHDEVHGRTVIEQHP